MTQESVLQGARKCFLDADPERPMLCEFLVGFEAGNLVSFRETLDDIVPVELMTKRQAMSFSDACAEIEEQLAQDRVRNGYGNLRVQVVVESRVVTAFRVRRDLISK